jgi:hypothetical protein
LGEPGANFLDGDRYLTNALVGARRFVVLATAVLLAGCSGPCGKPDATGDYELTADSGRYQLHLTTDGNGSLSRNGELIEHLSWQYERTSDQIFLNVSPASTQVFEALKHGKKPPMDAIQWEHAYYGLDLECTRSGAIRRLGLNFDGPPYFKRVR